MNAITRTGQHAENISRGQVRAMAAVGISGLLAADTAGLALTTAGQMQVAVADAGRVLAGVG